jgi:two-component system phosphate regulon sensor histidine kinase PhoR
MTVALVGIIIVQGYWLNSAIELEEQQFHKNVLHAMNVSAQRLDRNDKTYRNRNSRYSNELFFSIKTHTSIDSNYKSHQLSFEIEEENFLRPRKRNFIKKTTQILKDENEVQKSFGTSAIKPYQSSNGIRTSINRIKLGFTSFGNYRNIIEEINPHALSEVIKKELKNNGINTKFHIGLFSNNQLIVKEKGIEKANYLSSPYAVQLFEDQSFFQNNKHVLSLYFPKETGYLIGLVGPAIALSSFFILAILVTFWITFATVVNQKKTSCYKK